MSGQKTEKFVLNISDSAFTRFGDSLKSLSLVKAIQKCPGLSSTASSAMQLTANKVDTSSTPLTVWVNKQTKQIVQIASSSKSGSEVISLHYGQVSITPPSNPTPVLQFISSLESSLGVTGTNLSQLFSSSSGSTASPTSDKAKDAKRNSDLASLQTQLEAFFSQRGYYPSLSDMNNASWLSQNMSSLDQTALQDPDGSSKTLAGQPTAHAYAYQPSATSGASCESDDTQCAQYTLTATLSDGSTAVKQSLN